jgi:HlyD family secretion protein
MTSRLGGRLLGVICAVVMGIASAALVGGCHRVTAPKIFMDTAAVTRQSIVITVSATGTIEPAEVVLVKSKASGLIIKMPVAMGTVVKPGDLIAQIDPRDPQSRYNQALAALNAAKSNITVTQAQLARANELYNARALTAPEHETAVLAYANAKSQLATANTNLEVAQIDLADVTIVAPEAGTIIDKEVSQGQVIASATTGVSGGTTLVTLANLQNIVDSALVTEADIGKLSVGEVASVTVDAYPNKVFHGVVDKISPEAVTVQSVTMFPVIIKLDNSANLLKPGMNSDVSILVQQRLNVLVVPNDAIGTPQDVAQASNALGVDAAALQAALAASGGARAGRGTRGRGAGKSAGVARDTTRPRAPRALMVDTTNGKTRIVDSASGVLAGVSDTNDVTGGVASTGPHAQVMLVLQNGKWTPKRVMLGVGNYDETEVLSGLNEGDRVAMVSEIRVQAARDSSLSRIQGRGGLPGIGGGGGGGARGGAATGGRGRGGGG